MIGTPTLVPILEVFIQATGSKAGAVVLEVLVVVTGVWCLVACHTWCARLCWSFARDGGVPGSKVLSQVSTGKGDVPLAAHALSTFLVGAVGLLYLGSSTAFGSMVTACVVLLYLSYSIPVLCLLGRGRKLKGAGRGWFWMGKWGWLANGVLVAWTLVCLIMYSFPVFYPVEAGSKSYHFLPVLLLLLLPPPDQILDQFLEVRESTLRGR